MTIPLILFCDDTSGNKSKKWNKFIEWDLIIAGSYSTEPKTSIAITTLFVQDFHRNIKIN